MKFNALFPHLICVFLYISPVNVWIRAYSICVTSYLYHRETIHHGLRTIYASHDDTWHQKDKNVSRRTVAEGVSRMKGRRRRHKMLPILIGWKDEVSSLPCRILLLYFVYILLAQTGYHRDGATLSTESINAQNSGRRATRLGLRLINWPLLHFKSSWTLKKVKYIQLQFVHNHF